MQKLSCHSLNVLYGLGRRVHDGQLYWHARGYTLSNMSSNMSSNRGSNRRSNLIVLSTNTLYEIFQALKYDTQDFRLFGRCLVEYRHVEKSVLIK